MKDAGFPAGCTQAMHDAHYNANPETENARMERIERIARQDIITCAQRFCDWLDGLDADQSYTVARLISAGFGWGEKTGVRQTAFWELQGQIEHDYTQWLAEQEGVE
jgi:hypothetical protein